MIPLSSKVEKYRTKIATTESVHGNGSCILYCIAPIHGQEHAVLICDMFPVTENYILHAYTIGGVPYVIKNKNIQKTIRTKAMRYLSLVKRGILTNPLHILETKQSLINAKNQCCGTTDTQG